MVNGYGVTQSSGGTPYGTRTAGEATVNAAVRLDVATTVAARRGAFQDLLVQSQHFEIVIDVFFFCDRSMDFGDISPRSVRDLKRAIND